MSNAITIEGLDELHAAFNRAHEAVESEGKRYIRDWSIYGVKQVQLHTLNAGAVDTNELIQGMHYEQRGLTSEIKPSTQADKYALYVEEGTRPHFPPIAAIQGWADRHGIPAYVVARKISIYGTEPRHMFRDAFEDLQHKVDSEISELGDAIVRKI